MTFSWWLAAIPTCKSFVTFRSAAGSSKVSLTIAGIEQFFQVQRMFTGIGNQSVVLDLFSNCDGQDPVLTLLNPWCR